MFSSIVFSQEKIVDVQIDTLKIVQKNFDKEVLDAYKKEAVFNYEIQKREKNIFERAWSWLGRVFIKALSWIFEDIGPAVGLFKAVLQVVPYLILGLLLFFILKFFLKINSKTSFEGNEINPSIFAADEEDLLRHSNIEELITEAIEKNELRLAIRFYYLLVLQKLTEKELIVWQQEKTNEEYVKEVKKASIKEDFKETTHLYDFVWYGNFSMNNTEFLKAEQLFKSLTKKIIG
jgi:hypothetical protein